MRDVTGLDYLDLSGNAWLTDIQSLLDNPGLRTEYRGVPEPDRVDLRGTAVACA